MRAVSSDFSEAVGSRKKKSRSTTMFGYRCHEEPASANHQSRAGAVPKRIRPQSPDLTGRFSAVYILNAPHNAIISRSSPISHRRARYVNKGGWDEQNFCRARRRLRRLCVDDDGKALVRPLAFHCTRHTFASWALEAGKSIVWLQHALGHASPDTALRRYSHWVKQEHEDMGFLRLVESSKSTRPIPGPARPRRKLESRK